MQRMQTNESTSSKLSPPVDLYLLQHLTEFVRLQRPHYQLRVESELLIRQLAEHEGMKRLLQEILNLYLKQEGKDPASVDSLL